MGNDRVSCDCLVTRCHEPKVGLNIVWLAERKDAQVRIHQRHLVRERLNLHKHHLCGGLRSHSVPIWAQKSHKVVPLVSTAPLWGTVHRHQRFHVVSPESLYVSVFTKVWEHPFGVTQLYFLPSRLLKKHLCLSPFGSQLVLLVSQTRWHSCASSPHHVTTVCNVHTVRDADASDQTEHLRPVDVWLQCFPSAPLSGPGGAVLGWKRDFKPVVCGVRSKWADVSRPAVDDV